MKYCLAGTLSLLLLLFKLELSLEGLECLLISYFTNPVFICWLLGLGVGVRLNANLENRPTYRTLATRNLFMDLKAKWSSSWTFDLWFAALGPLSVKCSYIDVVLSLSHQGWVMFVLAPFVNNQWILSTFNSPQAKVSGKGEISIM